MKCIRAKLCGWQGVRMFVCGRIYSNHKITKEQIIQNLTGQIKTSKMRATLNLSVPN